MGENGRTGTTTATARDAADGSRLDDAMTALLGRAEVGVVATADAHGECDSSLRTGPPGFVRVLDDCRVAYPEYRGNGVLASLGNIEENPHAGLVLVDFAGDRSTLRLDGRARLVDDETLRADHPDLPVEAIPGRRTDLWVVLDLRHAVLEPGDEVAELVPVARASDWGTDDVVRKGGDYFGAAAEAASRRTSAGAGAAGADTTPVETTPTGTTRTDTTPAAPVAPAATPSGDPDDPPVAAVVTGADAAAPAPDRRLTLDPALRLPAVLGVLVVLLAAGLLVSLLTRPDTSAAAAPVVATDPLGPPTFYGRVVEVTDPATVVVDVSGRRVVVGVLGIDARAVPACATAGAEAFARRTLDGEMVTVVPDPTVAPTEPRRGYVVLSGQLSYTDAIVRAGWATPAGTALYRPVFDDERRQAQADRVGMFGPVCETGG